MLVKHLRMDNAGENKKLQQRLESSDWKLDPTIEFTARATPQHNARAELAFPSIANKGRAMMSAANLPIEERYKLFGEAFKTATHTDALASVTIDGVTKTRVEHWCGKLPRYAHHLRTCGEAGTVNMKMKGISKLTDRGMAMMFVGYLLKHEGGTYFMYNPTTHRLIITRDVIWSCRMYYTTPQDIELTTEPIIAMEVYTPPEVKVEESEPDAKAKEGFTAQGARVIGLESAESGTKDDSESGNSNVTFGQAEGTEADPDDDDGFHIQTKSGRVSCPP